MTGNDENPWLCHSLTVCICLIGTVLASSADTCVAQKRTPSVNQKSYANCSPNINGNFNVVNMAGCETLAQLQNRANGLAYDILEFDNDRHESSIEIRNQLIVQNMIDAMKNDPSGFEKRRAEILQHRKETVALFEPLKQRISALQDALGREGIDTRPISRGIATNNYRKIALMVSLVAQRIGKKPPYPRIITPLQVEAIFSRMPKQPPLSTSNPFPQTPQIEIYSYFIDENSSDLAKNLIADLKKLNWSVNDEPIKLEERAPLPTGIRLIFPSWDLTESTDFTNQFNLSELETTQGVIVVRQPPTIIKIEVWPAKNGNEVY